MSSILRRGEANLGLEWRKNKLRPNAGFIIIQSAESGSWISGIWSKVVVSPGALRLHLRLYSQGTKEQANAKAKFYFIIAATASELCIEFSQNPLESDVASTVEFSQCENIRTSGPSGGDCIGCMRTGCFPYCE